MSAPKADGSEEELKKKIEEICQLGIHCPHISAPECTKCIGYYITYFARRQIV